MESLTGALENLTVLDLTRVLAGPFCTMMLADMGANVIKIEIPKRGDDTRSYPPFKNGKSLYFANINRNKRGITLNLKSEEGREIFKELTKKADVVIENYRPGVMDKLGLGYEELKKINPRVIYAAVSGFGCYGPYSQRPGYDIISQGMGGLMSITGQPDDPPTRAGNAMGDILGGLNVAIGILAAVNARTLTGRGQRVDVSLVDSVVAALENTGERYLASGEIPKRLGNRYAAVSPYDTFKAKDGYFILACGNQKLYEILCREILNRPDLIEDPRFLDLPLRIRNQDDLQTVIEDFFKDFTVRDAVDLVLSKGVPAGPILDIKAILNDEHIAGAREMFVPLHDPAIGDITVNGDAIKLMDTKPGVRTPAPALGQHNREILHGLLDYSDRQISLLTEKGVL
ncbi:CoA transferase [Caproiciproducens sp. NJN-50]|uniref:CaiB/BaiF CoA transferase family protein n=1 Tax=Acutalibacteraceae TaxID=3082771 RepID=UPI000FFE0484|nr:MULTISPECIES: CoA transferase [Acutalibacteraceae]QAT48702.1 CoA transferase [Caproiciproducens sp. NJN-50]